MKIKNLIPFIVGMLLCTFVGNVIGQDLTFLNRQRENPCAYEPFTSSFIQYVNWSGGVRYARVNANGTFTTATTSSFTSPIVVDSIDYVAWDGQNFRATFARGGFTSRLNGTGPPLRAPFIKHRAQATSDVSQHFRATILGATLEADFTDLGSNPPRQQTLLLEGVPVVNYNLSPNPLNTGGLYKKVESSPDKFRKIRDGSETTTSQAMYNGLVATEYHVLAKEYDSFRLSLVDFGTQFCDGVTPTGGGTGTYVASSLRVNLIKNPFTPEEETILVEDRPFNFNSRLENILIDLPNTNGTFEALVEITFGVVGSPSADVFYLPIHIEGLEKDVVEVLGTTTVPQTPYLILHDPPGDGSFSTLQENRKTCRTEVISSQVGAGVQTSLSASIGSKGTLGIGVGVDYEFSVEVTAGFNVETNSTQVGEIERCVEISSTFATADANSGADNGDVFVGYGSAMDYGIYKQMIWNDLAGTAIFGSGFAFAEDTTRITEFFFTEEDILNEINALTDLINNSSDSDSLKTQYQNQIASWNQTLNRNNNNKANAVPFSPPVAPISFSGGAGAISVEESTTTSGAFSIEQELAVGASLGLEVVAEVGATGFGASTEVSITRTLGNIRANSGEASKVIGYTLDDDDGGDVFTVIIEQDPDYGTPIFTLDPNSNSKSSCPFEGGFQRDQPRVANGFTGCTENTKNIIVTDVPKGTSVSVPLDICNDSDEQRTYFLLLDVSSNTNGAELRINGNPFNTDNGVSFTIPANSCFTSGGNKPNLTIAQNALDPNLLEYENIRLFLYPLCERGESGAIDLKDEVFVSAFFTEDLNATPDFCDPCGGAPNIAFNYDGVDDFTLSESTVFNDVTNNFTYEFWVNPTKEIELGEVEMGSGVSGVITVGKDFPFVMFPLLSDNFYPPLPSAQNNSTATAGVTVGTNGIQVVEHNAAYAPATLVYEAPISGWTHVAIVYDNLVPQLYIDGVFIKSGVSSTKSFVYATKQIGGGVIAGVPHFYEGAVDQLRVWDYARTAMQIANERDDFLIGNEVGLVTLLAFNEGTPLANNQGLFLSPDNRVEVQDKSNATGVDVAFTYNATWDGSASNAVSGFRVECDDNCASSDLVINTFTSEANQAYFSQTNITSDAIADANIHDDIHFQAPLSITLQAPFTIPSGVTFSAIIADCDGNPPTTLVDDDSSWQAEMLEERSLDTPDELAVFNDHLGAFPNPFTQSTTIAYQVPESANVEILISDIHGKVVQVMVQNQWQEAGNYQLEWTPNTALKGVYFMQAQIGADRITKRLAVLEED